MALTDAQWSATQIDINARLNAGTITEAQAIAELTEATENWPTRTLSNADLAARVSRFLARLNGLILTEGPPDIALGELNTFAYDTVNGALYGPKTAAGWGSGVSLVGPAGLSAKQIVINAGLLPSGATDAQFAAWLADAQIAKVQPLVDAAEASATSAASDAGAAQAAAMAIRSVAAEAVSVEATAREQLIRPGEDDFTFQDALGFVSAVIGAGALDMIGWRIEASDEALTIRDQLGFEALSVTAAEGLRVMGQAVQQDAASLAAAWPAVSHLRTGVVPRPLLGLARWRKALGGTLQGLANARVLCIGDSNTMGWAVITGGHRRALAYPAVLAKLMSGVSADGFGRALTGTSGYTTYDPRLSIGAGWSATGATSLGGEMWVNAADASALMFAPLAAWDAAEVWMVGDGAATVQIGVAGSLVSYTPPAGAITRLTWTGGLAVQGLRIERVSGSVQIVGWSCYRTNAETIVYNAGRSGWTSGQYADNAQVQSPRNAIGAVGADLCLVQLGLNDRAQNVAPAVFRANLDAVVAACVPADVALIVSFEPGGSATYPWSAYVAEILDCARAHGGLPVVDMARRFGDRAAVVAAGWNTDDYHPNAAGLAETARAVHQIITL